MNLVLGNINHHFCNYAFQGFLNNGNVVAIKKYKFEEIYRKPCTYDLRLISKLQHKNLVKILGYVDGVEPSMKETKRIWNRINGTKYIWIEEYVPNGNLHQTIQGKHELYLNTYPSSSIVNFTVYI